MNTKPLTFEELPRVTSELFAEVMTIKEQLAQLIALSQTKQDTTDKDEMVGIEQACRILGLKKPTVYHKVRSGDIPTCRPSGCKKLMFKKADLISWMDSSGRSERVEAMLEQMRGNVRHKPKLIAGGR